MIYDRATFEEIDHIDADKLGQKKCDILSVQTTIEKVSLLQRCGRRGGVRLTTTDYSRRKKKEIGTEELAMIGDAEGRWENFSTPINNDSLMLYLDVDNTRRKQIDHYYLFDKKNQFALLNTAIVE